MCFLLNLSEYSGNENLELQSQGHIFNDWMYGEIFPAIKGTILEVGSGIGTFSQKIIRDFSDSSIVLTDVSPSYVKKLSEKFCQKNIHVVKLDLNSELDYQKIGYKKFDSIIAINVLEHVEDDLFALQQLYKMLKKDGTLILLVPCHKFLYNVIDSSVGHFRRYTKNELKSKIAKTDFVVKDMFYFNMLGILGWYINGNVMKTARLNKSAYKTFDKIIPIMKFVEKLTNKRIGLSIISFLKK